MTPETHTRGMALLAEAFPHREVTKATLRLYATMLADLDDDEFEAAVKAHIRRGKFFPTVAELVELARPAPTAVDIGPLFAKIELRALLSTSLGRITREFGPDVRSAILAAGGLEEFRRLDTGNNRAFVFRRFSDALTEMHRGHASQEIAPPPNDRLATLVASTSKVLAFPPRGKAS